MSSMRVLAVDPGLTRCGVGIVDGNGNTKLSLIDFAIIQTNADLPLEQRLLELEQNLQKLIEKFKPNVIAVERVFSQLNVRTAMSTAQAGGVALLPHHHHPRRHRGGGRRAIVEGFRVIGLHLDRAAEIGRGFLILALAEIGATAIEQRARRRFEVDDRVVVGYRAVEIAVDSRRPVAICLAGPLPGADFRGRRPLRGQPRRPHCRRAEKSAP